MASMADYRVLTDAPWTMEENNVGTQIIDFNLPSDFTFGTVKARPIVSFIFKPESEDGEVHMWVNPIGEWGPWNADVAVTWKSAQSRFDVGLWEAIQGDKLKRGSEGNFIVISASRGRARLRDVVLWYQRGQGD